MDFLYKLVCAVIALFVLCKLTRCQNECTYSLNITTGQHYEITNPSFPSFYKPGSDCTWDVTTSQAHRVRLTCDHIHMPTLDSGCRDYLAVTTTDDLRDASAFCLPFTVAGSSLKIQLISSILSLGGIFSCDITAEEIPVAGPNQTENCKCGWSQSTRTIGGTEAEINEFPSMVKVISSNGTHDSGCGGTIIAKRVVLTAAHCILDPEPKNNGVIVGEHYNITRSVKSYTKHQKISRVIVHQNGSESEEYEEDIALVETTEDILYSSSVGPACLPFNIKKEDLIGKYVTATGWGRLQNGSAPETLQKVDLQILPDSMCEPHYKNDTFIPEYNLCTHEKETEVYLGDSGGPLYYYNHQKSCHYVVGIVNHGKDFGKDIPSANLDIHSHLPWIRDQLPDVEFCNK